MLSVRFVRPLHEPGASALRLITISNLAAAYRLAVLSKPTRISRLEALVLLACAVAVSSVVLPGVQRARQGAAATCAQNLKNIALALQNYHDTFGVFPMGAMHAGTPESPRIGPSWWYAILPFLGESSLAFHIAATQQAGFARQGVEFTYASMPDTDTAPIQRLLQTGAVELQTMRCPDSRLPVRQRLATPLSMPSYVGIAGGCDLDPNSSDYFGCPQSPRSPIRYINRAKGIGPNGSIVTSSGMLPPNEHVRIGDCADGTSNTMIVAEQSDLLRSVDRSDGQRYRGDPGWNTEIERYPGGWISGTNVAEPVGPARLRAGGSAGTEPGEWRAAVLFNITTVRYPPGLKEVFGGRTGGALPGCAEVMGHNNPLQSPHRNGLLAAFADGSVKFIASNTDLSVLLQRAIRNAGSGTIADDHDSQ